MIREAQSALFPIGDRLATASPARGPEHSPAPPAAAPSGLASARDTRRNIHAPINGSWDLDVWGKIRRTIEADASLAQASAADLDAAKLLAQAQLATAYFNLLAADSLRDLLHRSAAQFRETYEITLNKFNAGYGPTATSGTTSADVALAQSQVLAIEAQELSVGVQRAQFEHAIAVLIGRPPAELTIGPRLLGFRIPNIPVAVPSALLERRPDIAAAERTMQNNNALIGVAEAAYFPDVSLSAMVQFIGPIPLPFSAARSIQQIGATATQTLFNGGLTGAQVDEARAAYLENRRRISAERAHRVSAGRGRVGGDPHLYQTARHRSAGGQECARSGARLHQSIPLRNCRPHHRGDGRDEFCSARRKPSSWFDKTSISPASA